MSIRVPSESPFALAEDLLGAYEGSVETISEGVEPCVVVKPEDFATVLRHLRMGLGKGAPAEESR